MPDEVIYPEAIPATDIKEIAIDSRKAVSTSLFVCLRGSFTDGHIYAFNAYLLGCRHFLCDREVELPSDAVIIRVDDSRKMLSLIAQRFYSHPSRELKIIGITGTKGKTTTALMITSILNACGLNCGYIGSNGIYFNNSSYKTENTTPESLILQKTLKDMVDSDVKYVALEVSSQALHTYRVEGIAFDTVVFTNLARDHIGKFEHPTFEHYIECKRSLFSDKYLAKRCIYNIDDSMYEEIIQDFKKETVSYSLKANGDFNADNIKYYQSHDGIGVMFDIKTKGVTYSAFLPIPGDFNVYNALCAFAACSCYVSDKNDIIEKMAKIKVDGRFEMYQSKKGCTFIIDYAHNGLSLGSALQELRKYCNGRLICLFGSVGDRTRERRRELGESAGRYADFCILTSDNPGFEDPKIIINEIARYVEKEGCEYVSYPDREEAIGYAYSIAKESDIILLAGKGHETYQLINGQKRPFSEKMIIKHLLSEEETVKKN